MLLLPATLTHREAADVLVMLGQALDRESVDPVCVDASALQHFDSSALAVLLEFRRRALALGRGFVLRSAPPKLSALAALYGVDVLLPAEVMTPAAV
jgi:phospholipid transport system transporter-binding protein